MSAAIWRIVTIDDDEEIAPKIIEERHEATAPNEEIAWHWVDGHVQIFWHGNLPDHIYYEVRPA